MKRISLADWIANVLDAEDMAIRKRQGLPSTVTAYDYHGNVSERPVSDFEHGLRRQLRGEDIHERR